MATLRLISLRVQTENAYRDYDFDAALTVITGSVGTGKSSLLMLVKHAFGGRAALTPAVRDHVTSVTLELVAGTHHVRLRRAVPDTRGIVELLDLAGTVEERLPVRARPGVREPHTISDRLLEWLEIPRERIVANRRGRDAETVSVTFFNLLPYLYLEAREIDRSIAGSADSATDRARKALFEILFGLTSPQLLELRRQEAQLGSKIRSVTDQVKAIEQFLRDVATPSLEEINDAQRTARRDLDEATEALETLHRDVTIAASVDDAVRRDLDRAVDDLRAQSDRVEKLDATVRARRSVVAQLELDLVRHFEAEEARRTLAAYEFDSCPRCAQSLRDRTVEPDQCPVCLQPEPLSQEEQAQIAAERLQQKIEDYRRLLDQDQAALEQQTSLASLARTHLQQLQHRLDEMTRTSVAPRLATAELLSERRSTLSARLERLGEARQLWRRLEDLRTLLATTQAELKRSKELIRRLQEELEHARERVDAASRAFQREVRAIDIPGIRQAEIRDRDYLPYCNGVKFDQVQASGGGVLTAIHIAYSLALIHVSLDAAEVLLPRLLIIDSPRKAIGQSEDDKALSIRIYKRLVSIARSERVQLIVTDNDLPDTARTEITAGGYRVETLGYGLQASVPGVEHPGFHSQLETVEGLEADDDDD